jgi:hypothetical protein
MLIGDLGGDGSCQLPVLVNCLSFAFLHNKMASYGVVAGHWRIGWSRSGRGTELTEPVLINEGCIAVERGTENCIRDVRPRVGPQGIGVTTPRVVDLVWESCTGIISDDRVGVAGYDPGIGHAIARAEYDQVADSEVVIDAGRIGPYTGRLMPQGDCAMMGNLA